MASIAASPAATRNLILLVSLSIVLNYADRGLLGIAAPLMMGELGLSATAFGIAVSAFFWIYAPIQFVIGWLCDRVCVYRLFAAGVALWAASTALTGLAGGLASLILLRLLLGIGESIGFPGGAKVIARHVSAERRGIANSALAAAIALGPAVGTLVGGFVLASFGWRVMFVVFGLVTLLWVAPWWHAVRPFLEASRAAVAPFPLRKLIGQPALWAMSVGHFAANYTLYFLLAWLPLYLVQSRGYSVAEMTLLATAGYLAQAASALTVGWASDRMVAAGRSEGMIRRAVLAFSSVGVGIAILGVATTSGFGVLLTFLLLAGACGGATSANLYAVAQMFAGPGRSGTWIGVQNAVGNFAGIVGPVITGIIIDRSGSYSIAFMIAAGMGVFGAAWWALVLPRITAID